MALNRRASDSRDEGSLRDLALSRGGLDPLAEGIGDEAGLVDGSHQFELPDAGVGDFHEHSVHLVGDPPRIAARGVRADPAA